MVIVKKPKNSNYITYEDIFGPKETELDHALRAIENGDHDALERLRETC